MQTNMKQYSLSLTPEVRSKSTCTQTRERTKIHNMYTNMYESTIFNTFMQYLRFFSTKTEKDIKFTFTPGKNFTLMN